VPIQGRELGLKEHLQRYLCLPPSRTLAGRGLNPGPEIQGFGCMPNMADYYNRETIESVSIITPLIFKYILD